MPPKETTTVTPQVCPGHAFAISNEYTITGRNKLSATLSQCEHQWIKGGQALILLGEASGWWRATGVQEYRSGTFSVRLAKTADGKGGRWMTERKLIIGTKSGEQRPTFICFGFFGGVFESNEGALAKVMDADLDASPANVSYCTNFHDGENEVEQSSTLSQFLADFPPLEVEDTAAWDVDEDHESTEVVDLGDAPRLAVLLSIS